MKKLLITFIVLFTLVTVGCINNSNSPQQPTTLFPPLEISYMEFIPDKPSDYDLVMREFSSGFIDVCGLDERYYLQPDFYAESWANGQHRYASHDYSRWVVHGHGAYPANPYIVMRDPHINDWASTCIFYRTGWGVETWQGIRFIPDISQYFDVVVTPNEMLLSPTYPQFAPDWARKISVNVSVKETPPDGIYTIEVNTVQPSDENSRKWFKQVFTQNLTRAQQIMVDECIEQSKTNDQLTDCERLINVQRRNKYIGGNMFSVGSRIIITIQVGEPQE